ncbi:MAG: hypothetical protein ACLTER_10780 [Ruminococcus sp.]
MQWTVLLPIIKIALKFNSSMAYGTAPNYLNNTFTGNGTAVCIENLPGNEVLDFAEVLFQEMTWTLIIRQSIRWIRRRRILRLLRSNAL